MWTSSSEGSIAQTWRVLGTSHSNIGRSKLSSASCCDELAVVHQVPQWQRQDSQTCIIVRIECSRCGQLRLIILGVCFFVNLPVSWLFFANMAEWIKVPVVLDSLVDQRTLYNMGVLISPRFDAGFTKLLWLHVYCALQTSVYLSQHQSVTRLHCWRLDKSRKSESKTCTLFLFIGVLGFNVHSSFQGCKSHLTPERVNSCSVVVSLSWDWARSCFFCTSFA